MTAGHRTSHTLARLSSRAHRLTLRLSTPKEKNNRTHVSHELSEVLDIRLGPLLVLEVFVDALVIHLG